MNLDYCPRCNKLYAKNLKNMCLNCIKEIELMYEKCHRYMRENRKCSITDLSENTGVSVAQITKFIREGRLSTEHAPNMAYPCEACGEEIKSGNLCESCRKKLTKDVSNLTADEKREQERKEKLRQQMGYQIKERE